MTQIKGLCDKKFEKVNEAFERCFEQHGDVGASCAITLEGEYVVDIWGGYLDSDRQKAWEENTIVNVYSTTKTMMALVALVLADRGELDLYSPVCRYWPEFARNGKEMIEVRHLLSHTAGLSGMDEIIEGEDLYDSEKMVNLLADQEPWWEPGSESGYHALTQGYLVGEVVRRVTGRTLGHFFSEEIAEPLGADFHIGTHKGHWSRIGSLIADFETPQFEETETDSIAYRTFRSPLVRTSASKTDAWRLAEIPAANGHGNARSVVRAQTPLANGGSAFGVDLLSAEGASRIFDEQSNGEDLVLGFPVRFGMGYGLNREDLLMGPNKHIAFWGGWGGSLVLLDQDSRLCISYVMNRMNSDTTLGDLRGFQLVQAAYQCLT
ncbi:MAG: serine hydrolase [Gammaproteobacteria bacterium]|nr:serine hydrolase [Gammaproteobacteria bacterium]